MTNLSMLRIVLLIDAVLMLLSSPTTMANPVQNLASPNMDCNNGDSNQSEIPALECPAGKSPGNTVNQAALCPWKYQVDTNSTRQPANIDIAIALCDQCLDPYTNEVMPLTTCKEVIYPLSVVINGVETVIDTPVAYTCLRLSTGEVPVATTQSIFPPGIIPTP